jgi:hypothetical protein
MVQETLKLVEFAYVHAVGELIEKFDKRCEPFDGGSNFGLEDFNAVFALNFLKVN